jgi:hypothetical protein
LALGAVVAVWLLLTIAGLGKLLSYSNRPGQIGQVPSVWPLSNVIQRSVSRPTMVLFAHPKCPCTAATLDELAWIMTRCGEQLDCQVLFVRPSEEGESWVRTANWSKASQIPSVNVLIDHEGRGANLFGARTSGHAMLYDADGRLQFEGGITPSRGHRGDNGGRNRVIKLVLGDSLAGPSAADRPRQAVGVASANFTIESTRVFGCPLFAPSELFASGNPVLSDDAGDQPVDQGER